MLSFFKLEFYSLAFTINGLKTALNTSYVTEPHRRGLYKRAPCSRVHLAYSLRQLRVGISPSLRPRPLRSIAQCLVDSSNIYIL